MIKTKVVKRSRNFRMQTHATETYAGREQLFQQIRTAIDTRPRNTTANSQHITTALQQGDYVTAIAELRRLSPIQEQYLTIQDATILYRNAKQKQEESAFRNWAIMGLNYFSATLKLAAAHGLALNQAQQQYLQQQAQQFYQNISQSPDPEIEMARMVHGFLLPLLESHLGSSEETIKKQLEITRDFCNFDHPTLSVATDIQIPIQAARSKRFPNGTLDILHIDVPMCGQLSGRLKAEYQTLADLQRDPHNQGLQQQAQKITWFAHRPHYVQQLMRMHAQDILNGKMIPTQLRVYFPGIRNAGEERLIDRGTGALIYRGYHAGNPGHLLSKESQVNNTATHDSVLQLYSLIGAQHLNIQTLLSPVNRAFSEDANLASQVSSAINSTRNGIHHSNTPLNAWRRAGFTWITRLLGLEPNFKLIGADFIWAEAKKITGDTALHQQLATVIRQYEKLRGGSGLIDFENVNLHLVSTIKIMAHLINQIKQDPQYIATIDPCQSGKDRQGLARIKASQDAVMLYVTDQISPEHDAALIEQERSIRHGISQAGMVRKQAGLMGGTLGAEGIKSDTEGAVPSSWKEDNTKTPIIEKTAKYNKELPKDPSKQRLWYKNPKFYWMSLAALISVGLLASGIGTLAGLILASVVIKTTIALPIIALLIGAIGGLVSGAKLAKIPHEHAIHQRNRVLNSSYTFSNEAYRALSSTTQDDTAQSLSTQLSHVDMDRTPPPPEVAMPPKPREPISNPVPLQTGEDDAPPEPSDRPKL